MVAPLRPAPEAARDSAGGRGAGRTGGAAASNAGGAAAAQRSRATLGTWLTPSAVAKAVGGELLHRGRSADGVTTDSRQDCKGQLFVALHGPNHDGHDHVAAAIAAGARGVLVDRDPAAVPGLDDKHSAFVVRVGCTAEALLRLSGEHRRRHRARVVGITGSCGKTTTKEWLGSVLAQAMPTVRSPGSYNNRIGVPLTLFRLDPETRAAVVEIGTSSPGEIGTLTAVARPDVAIVTCVAAAHLQGLGSVEGVAREKSLLPQGLGDDGLCILNGDDVACRAMAEVTRARVQFVAIDKEADWFATDVQFHAFGTSFLLQGSRPVTVPRLGTHNVYNALFVLAAATELGVPEEQALQWLSEVPVAARRLEPKCAAGVTVFDDTYNMNPESARAGLQAIAGTPGAGRRLVVFGEMLELGERSVELHHQLGTATWRAGIDRLVVVGAGARPIADGARAAGMPRDHVDCVETVGEAQSLLLDELRPGDRVLCKASRRVGLERLVDGLLQALGGQQPCTGMPAAVGLATGAAAVGPDAVRDKGTR
ncbi:MAG: UDP-N-acetylmuramoyl-tripeptide--D-alanyl-D-alanine ligase [Planctomycetota bacterium]